MQLAELTTQIFSGRSLKKVEANSGLKARLLGIRDVGRRLAPRNDLEEVDVTDHDEASRLSLAARDVVITSRGSNVRAAVAEAQHQGVIVGPNLIVLRLDGSLRPELLAAYLRHPNVAAQLLLEFTGSATAGFTIESLRRIEIEIASAASSNLLADLVQHVDAYSEYQRRSVALQQEAADEAIFDHLRPTHGSAAR